MVEAKVRRLMNFGAFVELVPDVEALLPLSELDWEPVKHPNQILKRGQTLSLKIIEFNPEEQRIVVSRKGPFLTRGKKSRIVIPWAVFISRR